MESVDEGTFSTEIGVTESLQLHSIAFLLTILSGLSTAFGKFKKKCWGAEANTAEMI